MSQGYEFPSDMIIKNSNSSQGQKLTRAHPRWGKQLVVVKRLKVVVKRQAHNFIRHDTLRTFHHLDLAAIIHHQNHKHSEHQTCSRLWSCIHKED